jgi:phosphate acetyltransferase
MVNWIIILKPYSHFGLDIAFEDAFAITKSKLIKRKTKVK